MPDAPLTLQDANLGAIARLGVSVPRYDRACLVPRIVHIGVGGFQRAHLALYTDRVAVADGTWGIVGLGLLPEDAKMAAALRAQDCLYTLIEKGRDEPRATVVGSLVAYSHAPYPGDPVATELIASPTTAILSLTITEAGYGEPSPAQLAAGRPTTFDRIAEGLRLRRERGAGPLTILSCDNVPGNGAVARKATLEAATRLDAGLPAWVERHCTFPSSMVDRITPVTAEADRTWLRDVIGIEDRWPVVAEPFRQWVLEDDFAAGRPAWEDDGALFTDRVHDWELYKLRLLNAGHSSMAYLAALGGLTHVDEAMGVPEVRAFLDGLLYEETVPTLTEIPGYPREDYVASVLTRFENTGVRDQVARLCVDGSAKFPIFLIPTVITQLERGGPVGRAATALAGWARYLGVLPAAEQAFDAAGETARTHAAHATTSPRAFLDYAEVFPPAVRENPRFGAAFVAAYGRIASAGPLAAMRRSGERTPTGAPR